MGQGTLAILPWGEGLRAHILHIVFFTFVGDPYPVQCFCFILLGPYLAHCFLLLFGGLQTLGCISLLFVVEFDMECT